MNVKELYQSCFSDNDEFSELFLSGREAVPVIVEEEGEPIALATVALRAPAQFNPRPKGQQMFAYEKNAKVAIVGGFCVRDDMRGKGYARQLMARVLAACVDLRCMAVFLSPEQGFAPLYEKFGFCTVQYARSVVIAQKRIQSKLPFELTLDDCDPLGDSTSRRLFATRVARIMNAASFGHLGLRYDISSALRLMAEGDAMDGGYIVQADRQDVAFCIRDKEDLTLAVTARSLNPELIFGLIRDGSRLPNFRGCRAKFACSETAEDAQPFMMVKYLRRDDFNKFLRQGRGSGDLPASYMIFEQY